MLREATERIHHDVQQRRFFSPMHVGQAPDEGSKEHGRPKSGNKKLSNVPAVESVRVVQRIDLVDGADDHK